MVNETTPVATGSVNKKTTVSVNAQGQEIDPQTGQVRIKQTGGGSEGPALGGKIPTEPLKDAKGNEQNIAPTQGKGAAGDGGGAQQNPDDIDIKKSIAGSEKETGKIDEKQQARIQKAADLSKAIDSLNHTEKILFSNSETGEVIGTKFKYIADTDGKTVYDYAQDAAVAEHITFIIPEDDPKDGSPIEKAATFFWNKPTF